MDERKLTLIVVPHGDLETKTFEISYRKLKVLGWISLVLGAIAVFMVAVWWTIAVQATRVTSLEQELKHFEEERAKVDSLAKLLADVEAQYARVRELLGADAPSDGRPPTLPELPKDAAQKGLPAAAAPVLDGWPLGTVRGSEPRGLTLDTEHPALDIAVPQGTYIRAVGEGTITAAAEDSINGKYIRIDHGGGYESMYSHASTLLVSRGDRVKRQQVIALSGSSGKSPEPHLHSRFVSTVVQSIPGVSCVSPEAMGLFGMDKGKDVTMAKEQAPPQPSREGVISIIGPGMRVIGDCETEGTLRIEGTVEGTVRAGKAVVVGKDGVVLGDIQTQDAVIGGRVTGTVVAESRLELQATCLIDGEIRARRIKLDEGGTVNGKVQMGETTLQSGSAKPAGPRPASQQPPNPAERGIAAGAA